MKFLVDRCVGMRVTNALRADGHDAVDARELGPDPGDQALLAAAVRDQRVLITIDQDFGLLIFVDGLPTLDWSACLTSLTSTASRSSET